jgi:alanine-alpha-ketoisovalerate/valine-pyruvate aminotransferase
MATEEGSMKLFEDQTIVEKLRIRAEIRRKIKRRPDGTADRISDLCEEAAIVIEDLTKPNPSVLSKFDVSTIDRLKEESYVKVMSYGAFGEPCSFDEVDLELFAKNVINEYFKHIKL